MTIANKLQLTLDTKQQIKQALINKGAEPSDVFSTYPALIEDLSGAGIAKPSIISPLNGATGVSQFPIITGSAYGGITEDGPDPHQDSLWEFASDSEFSNIVHTSGWTSTSLESYEIDGPERLDDGTIIYARVTYRGESGETNTSDPISFETGVIDIGVVIDGDIVYGQMGGDWLLAAPATFRAQRTWGSRGEDTSLPNNPNPDPNTGEYNTDVLVARGAGKHPAAELCRAEGYDLPNREELLLLVDNRAMIDAADTSGGSNTLASMGSELAWSSTEGSPDFARVVRVSDGHESDGSKSAVAGWVVPVRRIPV